MPAIITPTRVRRVAAVAPAPPLPDSQSKKFGNEFMQRGDGAGRVRLRPADRRRAGAPDRPPIRPWP